MKRRLTQSLIVAIVATLIISVQPAQSASAANGAQFDPGYIISDAAFYDGSEMVAGDVQRFLEERVPSCRTGYTCLKDYRQATPNMAASTYCVAYPGSAGERASDIIAKVGAACNISQKVLLVLLEKEQGLVSHTWPSQSRFDRATGFSCPDSAPCDPAYAGFFYQVYYAARQFQLYAQNPGWYNYLAGRTNYILFHPNTACGSSPVYIQNKATAGLYNYTPYQPNAAALANLYGTGDQCSSYGNRNFWRIYSDWFGSPTVATSLLRTADNSTVYLVSGDAKYPIPSMQLLTALSPLGGVGYVSQRYLDSFVTAHTVGRSLRSPGGAIYFYDAGIKLPFTSCAQAEDYGASCAADGYVQLTAAQIDEFANGPALTSVLGTVEGARYYISDGTRSEILDNVSQALAGITDGMNVLTENAVRHLPLAAPIVRDSAYVLARSTSDYSLLAGGKRHPVSATNVSALGVPARTTGTLWSASLALIPQASTEFAGMVAATTASTVSALAQNGRFIVTGGGLTGTAAVVSDAFVESYPIQGMLAPGAFIKSPQSATVYIVMPTDIRPISGWEALLSLVPPGQSPQIHVVAQSIIERLTLGVTALNAGTLVRSVQDATVYFVNGVSGRIALSDFLYTAEAGFGPFTYAPHAYVQAYPMEAQVMGFGFSCAADKYVAAGGSLHRVSVAQESLYPFTWVPLDQFTCAKMTVGAPAGQFIRSATDGSIYQLVNGEKRAITTMTRYAELSVGEPWLNVHARFAATIPTGPMA